MLFAEETIGEVTSLVYIDFQAIPEYSIHGQRMRRHLKKLFDEAVESKTHFAFKSSLKGALYEANDKLRTFGPDKLEHPYIYEVKSTD
jgi:hypothetical protein